MNIDRLQEKIRNFAHERDWQQFHSPKNIVMALNVEAGELMEHFQWMSERDSHHIRGDEKQERINEEIADVAIYLLRLCDLLQVNLPGEIEKKMRKNADKYPISKVYGSSKKYDEY